MRSVKVSSQPKSKAKTVVLLSGGLDSAANLAMAVARGARPVLAITANYGQRAAPAELRAARALAKYYGVPHQAVDIRWLGALGGNALTQKGRAIPKPARGKLDHLPAARKTAAAVWVPNRNGVLIAVASAWAERLGASQVLVGFNAEEAVTFPDNSGEFLNRSTRALALSTRNGVRVHCYTTRLNKTQMVRELGKLAQRFPRELVWSCYENGRRPCGRCESCLRLVRAFSAPVK